MKEKDTPVDISKDSAYLIPTDIFSNDIFSKLVCTYVYKLANTDDSPHSLKIDKELSIDQKDKLWERLL